MTTFLREGKRGKSAAAINQIQSSFIKNKKDLVDPLQWNNAAKLTLSFSNNYVSPVQSTLGIISLWLLRMGRDASPEPTELFA